MPGIQQTFRRIPPGPLTQASADELNFALQQLVRILNLNVVAPMWLIPNAGSYTIGIDEAPNVLIAPRRVRYFTEEVTRHTRRTLIQPVRPVFVRRIRHCTEEVYVRRPRRGGGGSCKQDESVYLELKDSADYTVSVSTDHAIEWDDSVAITGDSWEFPVSSDQTEIKYTGDSKPTVALLQLSLSADPSLPVDTAQLCTVNLNVNGSVEDTVDVTLCTGDTEIVQLHLDNENYTVAADDILSVNVDNTDATYSVKINSTGSFVKVYELNDVHAQTSP